MNKVFSGAVIAMLLILGACGSKKSPTGGKEDLEKPALTASLPAEFGNIEKGVIELSFSKYLDKSSVTKGLYIYPLIQNKKVTVERNKITIKILDKLQRDTNYFVTLSTRIKDIRGNALAENQTLVFASGILQRNRLSGVISYEESKDRDYPLQFSLFSADSVQVLSRQLLGGAFAIDELNPGSHIYRAYIDKNANGHYDLGAEPWSEGRTELKGLASIELMMSYVDTVLAKVSSVQPVSNCELLVTFSEPVRSLTGVRISRAGADEIPVLAQFLNEKTLTLITGKQDRSEYQLIISGLTDRKGNVNNIMRFTYWGSSSPDIKAPTVLSSNPRNGTSVSIKRPELTVNFSELIDPKTLSLSLRTSESLQPIDFELLVANPNQIRVRPKYDLLSNRSYQFIIDGKLTDYSANHLNQAYILNFLVLNPK